MASPSGPVAAGSVAMLGAETHNLYTTGTWAGHLLRGISCGRS